MKFARRSLLAAGAAMPGVPRAAPGLNELMGGSRDLYTDQLSTLLPHVRSGKLIARLNEAVPSP